MAYVGRILTRSPYYIVAEPTSGYITNAYMDLRIWSGDLTTDRPTAPTYEVNKKALTGTSSEIVFEISSLIRDYYVHNRDAYTDTLTTFADCLWIEVQLITIDTAGLNPVTTSTYLAQDGYGYFSERYNPTFDYGVDELVVPIGEDVLIPVPVGADAADSILFYLDGVLKNTQTLTDTDVSQNKLEYVTQSQATYFVDSAVIKDGVTVLKTVSIVNNDACKYTPKVLKFYNKQGALQVFYMFAKSSEDINTSRDDYKADLGYNYSDAKHQKRNYNVNGKEQITLNTDWIPESQNEVVKQILLSELVWVDDTPVNIVSNSVQYKTKLNDRLINYTLTFEYSANVIQDV